MDDTAQKNLFVEVWTSFRNIPLWVQLWMVFWLVPINAASLLFWQEENGLWVALLANIAMLLNLPVMAYERRISRTMALPHLPFWTPLVVLILWMTPDLSTTYGVYLWVLAATNSLSLVFDYADAVRWFNGDRD